MRIRLRTGELVRGRTVGEAILRPMRVVGSKLEAGRTRVLAPELGRTAELEREMRERVRSRKTTNLEFRCRGVPG